MNYTNDKRLVHLPQNITSSIVRKNNSFLFFLERLALPISWNIDSDTVKYLLQDDEIKRLPPIWIEKALLCDDCLVGVRYDGKGVIIVSLTEGTFREVEINADGKAWGNFSLIELLGSKLYCFTRDSGKVIIYCFESETIRELSVSESPISCGFSAKDKAYLFSSNRDYYFSFDYLSYEVDCHIVEAPFSKVKHVSKGNDCFYSLEDREIVVRQIGMKEILDRIPFQCTDICGRIVPINNQIIAMPSVGGDIFILDKGDKSCKVYNSYPPGFRYYENYNGRGTKYTDMYEDENYYCFPHRASKYILMISKDNGNIHWKKASQITKEMQAEYMAIKYPIMYEKEFSVPWFIELNE